MTWEVDALTIEENDAFRTRPSDIEKDILREKWRRAVAGSLAEAVREALRSKQSKARGQVHFLIDSVIQQLALDSNRIAPELQGIFSEHIELSGLSVGKISYPFRQNMVAAFIPDSKTLVVGALQPLDLRGYGETPRAAEQDLAIRVHTEYQRLSRLLPSEFTDDDSFVWNGIKSLIDVRRHEELTPVTRRKIGIVTCRYPFRIRWWDDENDLEVDLSTSPCELPAFEVGDWFDAAIEYDRNRKQVLRILTVRRLPPSLKIDDESKLVEEMMELKKISADDI